MFGGLGDMMKGMTGGMNMMMGNAPSEDKIPQGDGTSEPNKKIPDVPDNFVADMTSIKPITLPTCKYHRSYKLRLEKWVSSFETWVYDYPKKEKRTLKGGKKEELKQEMHSMKISPMANFKGYVTINNKKCEHWYFNATNTIMMGQMKVEFHFYVAYKSNKPYVAKFIVDNDFFFVEQDFDNVVEKEFDYSDFGIETKKLFPTVKEKVVTFVIDVSGSMSTKENTKDGVKTRLEVVKEELKTILGNLKKEQLFNVVSFSSNLKFFKNAPLEASEKNFEDANNFVQGLKADGGTAIYSALEKALTQNSVEAIYFLTDGEPSYKKPPQIVDMVKKRHEQKKIKIHCTNFFGNGTNLLKQISSLTGGEYIDIKKGSF